MIYVLEDDDSIRKLVVYVLDSQGYQAEGFPAPSDFWEAMKQALPDMVLLDSGKGSGQTFDWSLIGSIKRPYLLAGGITAENAGQAIRQLRPFGVDASSCLETDGFKDIAKMKAFAQAVRAAE